MAFAISSSIAKELGEQLDVRRLTAPCAGAREFKEWLEQLNIFDVRMG